MQPAFDSWDLALVALPVRSRLHSIEPIGIGTPFVESLTGYMIRLAAAHAVRVSDLIEYELRTSIPYFHSVSKIANVINGVNESAQNWVSALERFTLRDNLRFLTLLPFASLLKTPFLIRQERAWCPRCYESRKAQGHDVYEQLLWSLQPVEICPLHNTPLETSCPTCQAWVAQQFGQLLEIAPHAQPVGKENLQKVLVGYVDSFSEGNRSAIAETAGCRRTSFRSWYNGVSVARVDLLLRMCHELGVPLTSLVTGAIGIEPETAARAGEATQARRRYGLFPRRNRDQIRAALLLASEEQPAPSIREVARRLGYTGPTRLYAADCDLCRKIVRNFRESGRSHWWMRRGARFVEESVIRQALEESLALEMPLPVSRSARALGFETESPLTARFPDLCLAIKAKRTNVQAARRITVASALKAALSEDPPPTLEHVATKLGYATRNTVHIWEPRLCARLIVRWQRFADRSKKALKKRMKAMLKENPPPSLRDVYARLGITRAISYGNFPKIHCAIAARYREYSRRIHSKKESHPGNQFA
jgi:transcriptional regulator with XRE-family HTH domain